MFKRYFLILSIFCGLLFIAGCSGTKPSQRESLLDKNWGRSYETTKYRQMLNPDASQNLEPIVDLDGQAVDANVEKYRDSFKERRRQETVNILKLQ